MFRSYDYSKHRRQHSVIQHKDGNTYTAIGVPSAGNSADTRFFGKGKERKFVVKRPKYYGKFGLYDENTINNINHNFESAYRKEQEVWNIVYPDNKAELLIEGGLRLVLPYFPGDTLSACLSRDEITCCQQLLSVAYAVRHFNRSGFAYGDFNTDNVLIDKKANGTFQAYLIDFHAVRNINDRMGGNLELNALNILVPGSDWKSHYHTIDELIEGLIAKIKNALSAAEGQQVRLSYK